MPKLVAFLWVSLSVLPIFTGAHCHQWNQLADLRHFNSGPSLATNGGGLLEPERAAAAAEDDIHLESMEDLEHVAYLTMRNFNLTDESLLQSSWLVGLGNSIVHKQHQKVDPLASSDLRGRLELMLESFIWHLRNGHLKRLQLDELVAIGESLNYNQSSMDGGYSFINRSNQMGTNENTTAHKSSESSESSTRCHYLMNIYIYELKARHRNLMEQQQQGLSQQLTPESRVEYLNSTDNKIIRSDFVTAGDTTNVEIDPVRLMRLCRLAIKCHSTDQLVDLISGSWHQQRPMVSRVNTEPSRAKGSEPLDGDGEFELARSEGRSNNLAENRAGRARYPRSLRDSLSTSLAKLCPLMLFQLHDDDGLCTMRRDDRPPMVTVWGFATLFVTIVSFCSLIGLSITPLLGQTATDSSGLSEISGGDGEDLARNRPASAGAYNNQQQQHQHRACLNLFEGLAVGSLVGSALFSLIPQAFELQERESNQGFLLKALIIFFGIYLFFCSERLMRLILDTRQQRKKKKRLQHRSSNSIPPLPSTTADLDHHHHHHLMPFATIQSGSGGFSASKQSAARLQLRTDSIQTMFSNGRKNLANPVSFSGDGGGATMGHGAGFGARVNPRESRQQVSVDQHIEISKPIGADGIKSVNFEKRKKLNGSGNQSESLRHGAGLNQAQQHSTQSNGMNSGRQRRKTKKKSAEASSSQQQQVADGKRRKTRQQLQAAKRRRNKRLVQKLAPIHNESDGIDSNETTFLPRHHHHSQASCSATKSPSPCEDAGSMESPTAIPRPMLTKNSRYYLESSSSCSTYDSNDDLYNSNLSNGDDDDDDDDGGYFIASRRRYQNNSQVDTRGLPQSFDPRTQQECHFQTPQRASFHYNTQHLNRPNVDTAAIAAKQDISTVAWMIVLGDGLHNFIDGISIGAAFSESILSGVSISVAVICEEFPHELGDFAVLVSSGMTVRQALGYNFLSACTCYFGMAVGIILGDVNDGASYISALAAGVFLYIALVDMMGELSATLEETSRDSIGKTLKLLLLQNVGIFIGISIIFILSFIDF